MSDVNSSKGTDWTDRQTHTHTHIHTHNQPTEVPNWAIKIHWVPRTSLLCFAVT